LDPWVIYEIDGGGCSGLRICALWMSLVAPSAIHCHLCPSKLLTRYSVSVVVK